jgi:hypothetical protein
MAKAAAAVQQDGPPVTVDVTGDERLDPSSAELMDRLWSDDPAPLPAETPASRRKAAAARKADAGKALAEEPDEDLPAPVPEPESEDPAAPVPAAPSEEDGILDELLLPPGEARADEPPAEAAPEEPAPPENLDEKQAHAFKQLAFEKRELKRRTVELEAQLKAARENAQNADPQELFKLREQLEAAEAKLAKTDLASSKSFQQRYDLPIQTQAALAQKLMVKAGMGAAEARQLLTTALRTPDLTERVNLLSEEVPVVAGALVGLLEQIEASTEQRSEALRNWKQERAAIQETEKRASTGQTAAKAAELAVQAVKTNAEEANFMYRASKETGSRWNQDLQTRLEAVKGILLRADPVEIAKFVADGVSGRPLRDLYKEERSRRVKAEAELAKFRGTSPAVGGGAAPSNKSRTDQERERLAKITDNDELIKEIWK